MTKCITCEDLDSMEGEYPDGPFHGKQLYCDVCDADYYVEYGGTINACNNQAKFNHPELKTL